MSDGRSKAKVWSPWYVLHLSSGKGTRLKYRYPDILAGPGNTSCMISLNKWEYEFKRFKKSGVKCIRLRIQGPTYRKNLTMLSKIWILEDYLRQRELDKIDPEQGSLENW